jgi:hypothetical protein
VTARVVLHPKIILLRHIIWVSCAFLVWLSRVSWFLPPKSLNFALWIPAIAWRLRTWDGLDAWPRYLHVCLLIFVSMLYYIDLFRQLTLVLMSHALFWWFLRKIVCFNLVWYDTAQEWRSLRWYCLTLAINLTERPLRVLICLVCYGVKVLWWLKTRLPKDRFLISIYSMQIALRHIMRNWVFPLDPSDFIDCVEMVWTYHLFRTLSSLSLVDVHELRRVN